MPLLQLMNISDGTGIDFKLSTVFQCFKRHKSGKQIFVCNNNAVIFHHDCFDIAVFIDLCNLFSQGH